MIAGLASRSIGLDLGTANTLLYAEDRGVAVNEPSLVTVRVSTGGIEAAGTEAEAGRGRTPRKFRTVRPVRGGVIGDLTLCEGMLQRFLAKSGICRPFRRFQVAIAVPSQLTDVARLAIIESLKASGAAGVLLVEQVLAAARGAGLGIEEPLGRMVVDIGAGVTDIAVISLANSIQARTVPVAGDDMDAAIIACVRATHQLIIGERTAERVKIHIGSALAGPETASIEIKGRCMSRGVPREVVLCDGEIREALAAPVEQIVAAIRETLEQAPPELAADLIGTGILLTGGSALLRNLDRRISQECGIPVTVAADPLSSVIHGLAHQLKRLRASDWRRFGCLS